MSTIKEQQDLLASGDAAAIAAARASGFLAPSAMYDPAPEWNYATASDAQKMAEALAFQGKGWEYDVNNGTPRMTQAEFDDYWGRRNGSGSAGSFGGSAGGSSSSFGGGYTPGTWDGHSNVYLDALNSVMGYQPFSYDYSSDPLYKVYSDEYTRLGKQAMDDTMAKIAARTGGLASSYAATAGNQAYDNYMAELANKIPELRNQAYNEWQGNFNNLLNKYNVANGYDQFDYGVFSDAENRNLNAYKLNRDLAQQQYQNELAAAGIRAQYGDLGGYDSLLGTGLQGLYDQQLAEQKDANAIYAFADDGGNPYKIGTTLGQGYINSLKPGQSVTASDGSKWKMDDLGNITITDRTGRTYKISSGQVATPSYRGVLPAPSGGKIDLSTDIGKEVAAIPGAISKYLDRWDDMDAETRYMALVTSGLLDKALDLSSKDRYQVQAALNEKSQWDNLLSSGETMLTKDQYNQAVKEGDPTYTRYKTYDEYVKDWLEFQS